MGWPLNVLNQIYRARLQLLLDPAVPGFDWRRALAAALAGGVDLVQLRSKATDTAARVELARALLAVTAPRGVPLLINDDVEAAAALVGEVAGVHLGQGDVPVAVARARLGEGASIGLSTHSRAELIAGQSGSASHFGLGACFPTATKLDHHVLASAELAAAGAVATRPLFAIGGITPDNVHELVALGIRRVAVSSSLLTARDPRAAAASLRERLVAAD